MKMSTMLKSKNVCMALFAILLCVLSSQKVYSSWQNTTEIRMGGCWGKGDQTSKGRSLASVAISAYTDGNYLYIQNTSPNCDITVTITNEATGDAVYEHTFPQEATSYMVISIADLPARVYMLELSNLDGGYLIGNFRK